MAQQGKYFMIVSKLGGHVLGPEGGSTAPGARLVTCPRNDGDDRLYWYTDALTGTLRNKASGHCIHVSGTDATMNDYSKGNNCQQFVIEGNLVKNRTDGKVLDISGNNPNTGVPICVWAPHGGNNQAWDCLCQRPKYFMLKGEASGRVIDIMGASKAAGAKICLYDASKNDNQLWYEDRNGLIRSKLNDFVFDGTTDDITMQPYEPNNPNRAWVLKGAAVAQLANPSKVLDVRKANTGNGSTICVYDNRDAGHQKWSVQYV